MGFAVEPRLTDVVELDAKLPGLPEAWNGKTVAFIADLQVGTRLGRVKSIHFREIFHRLDMSKKWVSIDIYFQRVDGFDNWGKYSRWLTPRSGIGSLYNY